MRLTRKQDKYLDKMLEPLVNNEFGVFRKGYKAQFKLTCKLYKEVLQAQERKRIKRKRLHS